MKQLLVTLSIMLVGLCLQWGIGLWILYPRPLLSITAFVLVIIATVVGTAAAVCDLEEDRQIRWRRRREGARPLKGR